MLCRRGAIQRPVNSMLVAVVSKGLELAREIDRVPEKRVIQEFAPDRSDQTLNEWMRDRNVGHGLDLFDREHAQVGEPAMKIGIAGRDRCLRVWEAVGPGQYR